VIVAVLFSIAGFGLASMLSAVGQATAVQHVDPTRGVQHALVAGPGQHGWSERTLVIGPQHPGVVASGQMTTGRIWAALRATALGASTAIMLRPSTPKAKNPLIHRDTRPCIPQIPARRHLGCRSGLMAFV
jgi:hypothetical protein